MSNRLTEREAKGEDLIKKKAYILKGRSTVPNPLENDKPKRETAKVKDERMKNTAVDIRSNNI